MCFAAVVVQARLADFDNSVEEAAMDLGATPAQYLLPGDAADHRAVRHFRLALSFTLSLDDLVIASFTTGPGATTLPMKIYSQVRLGVTPEINAISTILIGIVTLGVLTAAYFTKRSAEREEQERRRAFGAAGSHDMSGPCASMCRALRCANRAGHREGQIIT